MAEDKKQTVILEFEVDVEQSVQSINDLTAANKALRAERNQLNIASKEGQKRAAELNAQIDKNTEIIKQNVSAIDKQKINIGNYKSALEGTTIGVDKYRGAMDRVHPALGKLGEGLEAGVSGFKAMTMQALTFLATPIGAVIAAIGAALYALTKYFQGSEKGQDRLNKIMAVGGAIMEQLMNVVEDLGEAIFDAINNPQQALKDFGNLIKENLVNRFNGLMELIPALGKAIGLLFEGKFVEAGKVAFDAATKVGLGVENATDKITAMMDETGKAIETGIAFGKMMADLEAKITVQERALVEDRARTALKVAKLRQQAIELEGEERIKAIKQAIALEEQLAAREVEIAKNRLAAAELAIEANGDDTDALNARAEASAKVTQAEQMAFDNTLKFRKELEKLNEESAKAEEERAADARARERAASQVDISTEDPLTKAFATQAQIKVDLNKQMLDQIAKQNEKFANDEIERQKKVASINKMIQNQKIDAILAVGDAVLGAMDQESDEYKAFATAQTLISTYATAQKAYEAAFVPPTVASPALGIAYAAAAVIGGLANVARINGVEFAEGGWTGPGSKYQVAGVVHADEYVTPKHVVNNPSARPHLAALESMRLRPYFDGGLVTRSISSSVDQNFDVINIIKHMPPPEVSVKEVTTVQRRVNVKQQISKR